MNGLTTAILAGAALVSYMVYNKSKKSKAESFGARLGPGPVFAMFYRDSCPHCVAAKPAFKQLVARGKYKTEMRDLADAANQTMAREYGVDGVPTFILSDSNGASTTYSGPRTLAGFEDFLRTNYN